MSSLVASNRLSSFDSRGVSNKLYSVHSIVSVVIIFSSRMHEYFIASTMIACWTEIMT